MLSKFNFKYLILLLNKKMKKALIFSLSYLSIIISVYFLNLTKYEKTAQNPGWTAQFNLMKNVKEGDNYFGLRNKWAKSDLLYKKNSNTIENIKEVGPDKVGGRVRALLIDAADSLHLFAGGISGGLWQSYNGGKSWLVVSDQEISLAVSCITQNPFNPNEIYYGTGEGQGNSAGIDGAGIFKSTDGGKSFTQITASSSISAFATIWDIEYSKTDSSTFYIGTGNGGLYRTVNKGKTFELIYPTSKEINEILTYNDSTIWFGVNSYALICAKESKTMTFTRFTDGMPLTFGRISMNYCRNFPNVAYCQFVSTSGSSLVGIYKTSNHGKTWRKTNTPSQSSVYSWAWYCLNTMVSPVDTNFVIAESVKCLASTNGGTSWAELATSHADFHSGSFYKSGKNFLIGNDGGVYLFNRSTFTSTRQTLNNGLNITQFYTGNYSKYNSDAFVGGTQDNGTILLDGTDFSFILGGDGSYCAFSNTEPFNVYASSQNGEIRRLNKYYNLEKNIKPSGSYLYYFINPFEVNPLDGNQVYILSKTKLIVSVNRGDSWAELTANLSKQVLSMGISYENDPTIWAGGSNTTLYRCKNASTLKLVEKDLSETAPSQAKGMVINCIKVDHQNPSTIYISMSDLTAKSKVWKLNHALGDSCKWINISGNLPTSLPVNAVEVNPQDSNMIIAGTDFGVYTTSDGGKTWFKETSIPNVTIFKIVSHPRNGKVFIFTHGRGVFEAKFKNFKEVTQINSIKTSNLKITYNNPIQNVLKINIDNNIKPESVIISDFNGNTVFNENNNSKNIYDLSTLKNGTYILRIKLNDKVFNYKILKI